MFFLSGLVLSSGKWFGLPALSPIARRLTSP